MQKVSAYLLERRVEGEDAARTDEARRIRDAVLAWLRTKGADACASAGAFEPVDGGDGSFSTEDARDGGLEWWMLRLTERSPQGLCFETGISITTTEDSVAVYVSLEAGRDTSQIRPLRVDPRCPRVVHSLLALGGDWFHGPTRVRGLHPVRGFEEGATVAQEILDPERRIPVVIVSENEPGELPLRDLDRRLGRDLAGLANVYRFDADATWALTDTLGRKFCCFNGAIRVYWPRFHPAQHPLAHPRWTVQQTSGTPEELNRTGERMRRTLRVLLMGTAALSVVRPRRIDDIRRAAARRVFDELRKNAASQADYLKLAEAYAQDNDRLRADLESYRERIGELETAVDNLELRLRTAEGPRTPPEARDDDLEPDVEPDAEPVAPRPGETRFYKKVHSAPTHDLLTLVADCGCNRWEPANKADKAKKGVARLEKRNDWKSFQHCARCTGGGMWKVRW